MDKVALSNQIEQNWCEDNQFKSVLLYIQEDTDFKELSELEQSIMAYSLLEDLCPITDVIGQVAHRVSVQPTPELFEEILETIMSLSDRDFVSVITDNIAYIQPEYVLPPKLADINKRGFIPPLLRKPKKITKNNQSGYWINKYKHSVLGARINQHDESLALDVLNKQNAIPLCINKEFINSYQPSKPVKKATTEHKHFKIQLKTWIQFHAQTDKLMEQLDNTFYLTHQFDKRGRIYCRGYHISYQGDEYRRAMVEIDIEETLESVTI